MSILELGSRFLLLTVSVLILYFFSNRNKAETIHPLYMVVGLCTFSLCYLFTKIDIGIGVGFGLFAIFSVLRFRAKSFSINGIIFMFASLTLSILDVMYPVEQYGVLIFFQVAILILYLISSLVYFDKVSKYSNSCELVVVYEAGFSPEDKHIRKVIKEKTDLGDFHYEVILVNTVDKEVKIKVYY
ncbi:MAG: DUF4956 domain-containing protein [Flavobacterium sp. BFFFF1]|uniref:DUF4956 domain-containing protein n=1 Tax=unclassified Flavobacterium TaxID=196869 RepID=UPI000BCFA344|nr:MULTISPECIES: DUF4956 domain-containing protein [unclassified Flavobacterium]OYU81734.1 MAG: DUF4956 domain-containing protein [Flavobacterium sp. BFFFF1]